MFFNCSFKERINNMKKHSLFITFLTIAVLFSLAIPSPAYAGQEPVGERIAFSSPPVQYPAGAPFNIRHGWVQTSDDGAIGIFDFQLEVDGSLRSEDVKLFSEESVNPDTLTRVRVYNFTDGMSGTHNFTGHWYAPCQYAVEQLGFLGICATPNEKVETNNRTMTITFVP